MMSRGNTNCFDYAINNLPSQAPIVEIGSFLGLSANTISYLKNKYQKTNPLITCDKWSVEEFYPGNTLGDHSQITFDQYNKYLKQSYINNIQMFSNFDLPYTIEKYSDDFFSLWEKASQTYDVLNRSIQLGGPISFCYIDGNHSYEYSRRDFLNCDKHLEKNGFVLFDDSHDGSGFGVCKVMGEVMATGRYKLIDKNPNYFFKKIS